MVVMMMILVMMMLVRMKKMVSFVFPGAYCWMTFFRISSCIWFIVEGVVKLYAKAFLGPLQSVVSVIVLRHLVLVLLCSTFQSCATLPKDIVISGSTSGLLSLA